MSVHRFEDLTPTRAYFHAHFFLDSYLRAAENADVHIRDFSRNRIKHLPWVEDGDRFYGDAGSVVVSDKLTMDNPTLLMRTRYKSDCSGPDAKFDQRVRVALVAWFGYDGVSILRTGYVGQDILCNEVSAVASEDLWSSYSGTKISPTSLPTLRPIPGRLE